MSSQRYDLVVIGSGPAGQKAAIAATKLGRRVAIVDGQGRLGGVCLRTGTIPSKTLREAVLYLTGFRQRTFYGKSYRLQDQISTEDLDTRVQHVIAHQHDVVHDQLRRNDVEILEGFARFTDPNTVEVVNESGRQIIESDFILIACGTRPARRADIPFDHPHVMDADQLYEAVHGRKIARSCIVVGAGVIGLEYAAMMAALGMTVTVIDMRKQMLDFVDREMIEALAYHMRRSGVTFRLGETVNSITVDDDGMVAARLESGKVMTAERLLYAVGRQPNTDNLNIEAASLTADDRGRLSVNEHGQTDVPHIYAAGDVIGFPALASTSMEQGRLAACHMFGERCNPKPELLPYGIYTIPEISMVGRTEAQLTAEKIPWKVGLARFEELAKAQIIGDETGLLKLIFEPTTLKLLGVHIIGDGACELVHIGQLVMASEGTMETLRDTVFNYPTLAEAYKVAALDGLNKVGAQHTHATA